MRTSNQFAARRLRIGRLGIGPRRLLTGLLVSGLLVAACGEAAPSLAPVTPRPTPVITPNPQLTDPASADVVFTAIARAGLPISANNAAAGKEPLKQINATYADWPMLISEYSSAAALAKTKPWEVGDPPVRGDAPVSIVGLNILIEWGPTTGGKPATLDDAQVAIMNEFLGVIDRSIGPLVIRSTVQLQPPTRTPGPDASPVASDEASPPASTKPKASP